MGRKLFSGFSFLFYSGIQGQFSVIVRKILIIVYLDVKFIKGIHSSRRETLISKVLFANCVYVGMFKKDF